MDTVVLVWSSLVRLLGSKPAGTDGYGAAGVVVAGETGWVRARLALLVGEFFGHFSASGGVWGG